MIPHVALLVADPPRAPEDRSTEFVAVEGGNDGTSAESLLVAAYAVMWVIVFGFVFLTFRRQGRVEARLAELESAMRKRDPGT